MDIVVCNIDHNTKLRQAKIFDVAVLFVSTPFLFDDYVRPACLPAMDWGNKFPGGKMIASGFGVSDSGIRTGSLKIATIEMNSKQNCKHIFRSIYGSPFQGTTFILVITFDSKIMNQYL